MTENNRLFAARLGELSPSEWEEIKNLLAALFMGVAIGHSERSKKDV